MICLRALAFWIAAAGLIAVDQARGDVRLPKLIGDHMVLQRDRRLAAWGWADPGETVRVSFRGETARVNADKTGHWLASLGPNAAGGPYELVVSGRNRIVLHDVLVGDVWLASGQSNMEFPLKAGGEDGMPGVVDAEHEAAGANFPISGFLRFTGNSR